MFFICTCFHKPEPELSSKLTIYHNIPGNAKLNTRIPQE